MSTITVKQFKKICKEIFTKPNKSEKRFLMIGINYLISFRITHGDKKLYDFIMNTHIQCGQKSFNYIQKFIKEFELKKHKTMKQ